MPLKRTPPNTSQNSADSDINPSSAVTDTENESRSNVLTRHRARKRQYDDELTSVITELKKTIETFKNQQETLQSSINDIRKQNDGIIKSMEFMSAKYDEIDQKLSKMEFERKTHLAYIQTLEARVENSERLQKQASIEIRNIPIQTNETKEDLINVVQKIGEAVNVNVERNQIRDVFRLHTNKVYNQNSRTIIVDLTTVILKDKILTSVKNYNRKNKDNMINTGHIKIDGKPQPIFVVECLTQAARRIYFLAREFSRKNEYNYCWIAHGKVFIRRKEGSPARRINSEADLEKLLSKSDK
ncbi:unnamed protein product [Diatraea saccharalis]|uniref:FP protein C-terminal domain-containing protein n=1 Tax=Diatraea saccharalis TaxID=40085 RepID=A0A9N9WFP3_9NEOP|nr:unnamed protein product [Diatraea saccharalis]